MEVQVTYTTTFSKLVINVYTAQESKGQKGLKHVLPSSNTKIEVILTNINNTDDLILQMISSAQSITTGNPLFW
jgi:hypothetical protein